MDMYMANGNESYLQLGRRNAARTILTELQQCSLDRPSQLCLLLSVGLTLNAFLTGFILREFLVGLAMLHRYCHNYKYDR